MILESLHLKAYGGFTDRRLDLSAGPNRFHIVYGANESGKSTTLRAVTSLLYGFESRTDDDYLHPMANLRVGGTLADVETQRRLQIIRRKGTKRTLLTPDENDEISEQSLIDMLGGVSREDFATRFGLSHDELVAGGHAICNGEGDLGEILFSAGAGIKSLRAIQDDIDASSRELFKPRASNPTINRLIGELAERRSLLRQQQVPTARYRSLASDHAEAAADAEAADQAVVSATTKLQRLDSIAKALPMLPNWHAIEAERLATANVVLLDEAFTERRRHASEQLALDRDRMETLAKRIDALVAQREEHPVDANIVAVQPEIESLFAEKAAVEKGVNDRDNLMSHRSRGLRGLKKALAELSIQIDAEDDEDAMERISDKIDSIKVSESGRRQIIELANVRGELIAKRERALEDAEAVAEQFGEVQEKIDALPPSKSVTELRETLSTIGNADESLAGLESLVVSADEAIAVCQKNCARLVGFDGDVDQAASLTLPHPSEISRLETALRASESAIETHRKTIERLVEERREIDVERQSVDVHGDLPSEDDLRQTRSRRDATIEETSAEEFDDRKSVIQQQVRRSDEVVDTLRQQRERVLRIQQCDARLVQLDQLLTQTREALDAETRTLNKVTDQWRLLWSAIGVDAGNPESMRQWVTDHGRLLDAVASRDVVLERRDRAATKLRRRMDQLVACLDQAGDSSDGKLQLDDLPSLVHRGLAYAEKMEAIHRDREQWIEQRERLRRGGEAAKAEAADATKEMQDWQQQWAAKTAMIGDEQTEPAEVVDRLNQITELIALRKETQLLFIRIRSMTDDETTFVRRVSRIAEAVDEGDPPNNFSSAMVTLSMLHSRLQTELQRVRVRRECDEQIKPLRSNLQDIGESCRRHELTLETLASEVGVDDVSDLPALERDAAARRELMSRHQAMKNQFLILAGGQSVEDFIESIKDRQPAEIQLQIEQGEEELSRLRSRASVVHQRVGALRHELDQIDGDGDASATMQDIQMLAGQIQGHVRNYVSQRTQLLLLRKAIEHYRNQNESPVLKLASEAFRTMTLDRYKSLRADFDSKGRKILAAVPGDGGGEVPANLLSTGTADALYLSLRLASLQHQIEHANPLPLIVDDCLVQLDEQRSIAAMKLFSRLSAKTQVILFTHHQHLVDLAKQSLPADGVHHHELVADEATPMAR